MNKIFGTKEFDIETTLSRLEKGERLGIDETSYFLKEASRFLGKDANLKLLEAAQKMASLNPAKSSFPFETDVVLELNHQQKSIEVFKAAQHVFKRTPSKVIRLNLTPSDILRITGLEKIKVSDFCRSLSDSGVGAISGRFEKKEKQEFQFDESFSVMMMCQKFGIQSSAYLPLSFSDTEKIHHLAKVREFADRTRSISFLVVYADTKVNEQSFLKTVALSRLMLDNLKYISISDSGLNQKKILSEKLLVMAQELGLNLI